LIQLLFLYYLPLDLPKLSTLSILSNDLFKPSKLERLDIFKIISKNKNKNAVGIRVYTERLLNIKNK
tara:strand:- start:284 stop:484 length:201 start_codon:yes stop_codon:yes gene_type:complete